MESIIPLMAIGGLAYSMGDESKKSNTKQAPRSRDTAEGYTNMNRGNNVPGSVPDSYPVPQQQQSKVDLRQQNTTDPYATHAHTSSNTAAASYFDQNKYYQEGIRGTPTSNTIKQTYSLTGNYIDESNFKHNNMTPFYSGRTT